MTLINAVYRNGLIYYIYICGECPHSIAWSPLSLQIEAVTLLFLIFFFMARDPMSIFAELSGFFIS